MKGPILYIAAGVIAFYFYSKNQKEKAEALQLAAAAAEAEAARAKQTASRAVSEAAAQKAAALKKAAAAAKKAVPTSTGNVAKAAEAVNTWTKKPTVKIRIKNTVGIPEVLKAANGSLVNTGKAEILTGGTILSRDTMKITGHTTSTGRVIVSYKNKIYTIEPAQFDLIV